jgi:hypothetical protein
MRGRKRKNISANIAAGNILIFVHFVLIPAKKAPAVNIPRHCRLGHTILCNIFLPHHSVINRLWYNRGIMIEKAVGKRYFSKPG